MSRKKRMVSLIISCIFAFQILATSVFNPFGTGKVKAANQEYSGEIMSSKAVFEDIVPQAEEEENLVPESFTNDNDEAKDTKEVINESQSTQDSVTDQTIDYLIIENEEEIEQDANNIGDEQFESEDKISSSDALIDSDDVISSDTEVDAKTYSNFYLYDTSDDMQPVLLMETTDILYGDVNDDGSVNSIDFAYLKMYLLGMTKSLPNEVAADLDGNGVINSIDYAYMKQLLLGMIKPEDLPAAQNNATPTVTPTSTEVVTPEPTPTETKTPVVNETPAPTITPIETPIPTESKEKPLPPKELKGTYTDSIINLIWKASETENVIGYKVYRNDEEIADIRETYFSDTSLETGITYYYYVTAYDSLGNESVKSNILSTGNTVVSVEKNGETSITISWDEVVNAVGYEVCADGIITKTVTGTSFEHSGLIKNTWHSYKVRAKYTNKDGAWSNILRVCTAPEKPIEIYGEITSDSTATITWESVPGASNYQILRNDETAPVIVEQPSLEVVGLVPGNDYIYEVKAIDKNGFEMGNSGRILINTGEGKISKSTVFYENRVYGKNLSVTSGTCYLNTYGIFINGNLSQGGSINVDGGYLKVKGNYNIGSGTLTMKDENDYVLINGNFVISSRGQSSPNELSAGIIEINGDIYQKGYEGNLRASGNHKVVMSGNKYHKIHFEGCGFSYLNILELKKSPNGEATYIEFTNESTKSNCLYTNILRNDGCIFRNVEFSRNVKIEGNIIVEGNLHIANSCYVDLNGSIITVNGSVTNRGTLDLNCGKLFVNGNDENKGDFLQVTGLVYVNGGYLEVQGNYTMGYEPYYGDTYAELKMQNENDYIKVFGDFIVRTLSEPDISNLSAGTIEIKGDFYQYRGRRLVNLGYNYITYFYDKNFRATGTHKVYMSGDKKQKIYFESPSYYSGNSKTIKSTFNILCINKPLEYGYIFEYGITGDRIQPWNAIEEVYSNANPPAGTTITKPSLTPAREGLGMAEVNGRIYAFGGKTDNNEYLNTVSEYDYIADKWTEYIDDPDKQMLTGKSNFAIAATDNDIYIFGGFDGTNYFNTVERHNPAIGEFIFRDSIPPMPTARSEAKAVLIDNKIYVVGGINETGS